MKTLSPLEIFTSGQHTAMNGATITFSESDVVAIAANYDPKLHEAPLVVGHPAADLPAYGWVGGLSVADGVLSALPTDVDPEFADLVNTRRFAKISAAFYEPTSPNNPVKGVYYLRHVGFLGAQPPAVKGLRSPQFADDDLVICFECSTPAVEFSIGDKPVMTPEQLAAKAAELKQQEDDLAAKQTAFSEQQTQLAAQQTAFAEQNTALQTQLAKTKAAELDTLVTGLVKEGRVLPKDKNALIAFMSSDKYSDVIEFAENGAVVKQPTNDWLVGFLKALPVQVEFAEVAGATTDNNNKPVDNKAIARRAQAYKAKMDAQGNNLSFAEAVDAVVAGQDGVKA